ncbi:protein phosphatase 2C [Tritrichomonas foetus]|uniref:Protein phosphatase 2C n=1 Tax=Tritrichomonas foetus TaxID=1144522 RepID=A0A1J4JWW2_9EUKA|nr:protein phosphatase 2C [Tritrichomonas foetus]|eukprot:OHT03491.1 protein phosphatase 2C [Tritrichomonas foetus]
MGTEASRQKAQKIVNLTARTVFLNFIEAIDAQPNDVKNSSKFKKMAYAFYKSCKNQPEGNTYLSLVLTGKDIGPQFVKIGINFLRTYSMITKISLRASSLSKEDAVSISRFIKCSTTIKEIDLSENKLGNEGVSAILSASVGHPRLEALILESTGASDSVANNINELILKNSCLKILRLTPLNLSSSSIKTISASIKNNTKLTLFTFTDPNTPTPNNIKTILDRNNEIHNIVDEIISAPWHRTFKKRNDLFKSVKGRRMAEGRVQQMDKLKGTPLHHLFTETQQRATNMTPCHNAEGTGSVRIGTSETIGVREAMEDFTVIKQDFMNSGTIFVGLFDGHGGREASEYSGNNLPTILEKYKQEPVPKALENTFSEVHKNLQPWCPYVGTTACVALLTQQNIVVANVGDTRCVMVKNNQVKQLTIDHKPDIPEEKKFIEKHGGYVEQERVNGMLAISRSLGDSAIGDAINCKPYIAQENINGSCIFIFACDGVWDVISNEDAANIVKSEIDPMLAARKLRDSAMDAGSTDNISVVVIFISGNDQEDSD